jgi:hypothetical protein
LNGNPAQNGAEKEVFYINNADSAKHAPHAFLANF